MQTEIDTTFDFRSDTRPNRDPDTYSQTLCSYHKLLWSKPLPGGAVFELEDTNSAPYYLHHRSEIGTLGSPIRDVRAWVLGVLPVGRCIPISYSPGVVAKEKNPM